MRRIDDHMICDIQPGRYRHYKGDLYTVHGVAQDSETLAEFVVYENDSGKLWIRAKANFLENVQVGDLAMSRFEHLNETFQLRIKNWHPARLNQFVGRHWSAAHKLKKLDREIVSLAVGPTCKYAHFHHRRRVSLRIVLKPGQRKCDPDAYWKSLLDALVATHVLRDDSDRWCVLGEVTFTRAKQGGWWGTVATIEDIAPE
jgi:hypothetical protein